MTEPKKPHMLCPRCNMLAPLARSGIGPHRDVHGEPCRHRKQTWNGKRRVSSSDDGIMPADVANERDWLGLQTSTWNGTEFWMLVQHDGAVSICQQCNGERVTASITIPRRTFQRMLDWYYRPQGVSK